ncbi:MAG: hypothetical protein ACK4RT_01270 [Erythrobacter sp.]
MATVPLAVIQADPVSREFQGGIDKVLRVAHAVLKAIRGLGLYRGGWLIAAPDTRVIAQADEGAEALFAQLDFAEVAAGLTNRDTDGRYARPAVFKLTVDRRAKDGGKWR